MLLFGDKEPPVSAGGFYLLGCLPIGGDAFFPSKIRDVNFIALSPAQRDHSHHGSSRGQADFVGDPRL